jgi:hypothetical protein
MSNTEITREEWLTESARMIMTDILYPSLKKLGFKERPNFKYKISLGYAPNTKTGTNIFAVCLHSKCSATKFNEIYVTPSSTNSILILGAVVHELIHGLDDLASGHNGFFAKVGRDVDLAGLLTATRPGVQLSILLQDYIDLLGEIPHDQVDIGQMKRQKNRNHLVQCPSTRIDIASETGEVIACGFRYNTSQKVIDSCLIEHGCIPCTLCGGDMIARIK